MDGKHDYLRIVQKRRRNLQNQRAALRNRCNNDVPIVSEVKLAELQVYVLIDANGLAYKRQLCLQRWGCTAKKYHFVRSRFRHEAQHKVFVLAQDGCGKLKAP
jgi:hypothetical protein